MTKLKLTYPVSILVNNICNMTCSHCAGLAMYDFKGNAKWSESAEKYIKWGEILEVLEISLCGGEPYLNPELEIWFDEVRKIWPNTFIEVMTNGTRMSKKIDISRKIFSDGNARVTVSCHEDDTFDKIKKEIEDSLAPWGDAVTSIETPGKEFETYRTIQYFINGREVCKYMKVTEMFPPYHKKVENGTVYFEMGGDQEASHAICGWKAVYTFQHGYLYKCPPVTNYPDAKKQVRYEPEAQEILEKYQGCNPLDDFEKIKNFIDTLDRSIEVCKLCAFDKRNWTGVPDQKVTLDVNRKKQFKQGSKFIEILREF